MKTYYHNLTLKADEAIEDYEDVSVYYTDNVLHIPLVEFTNLKTGLSLLQFIQGVLPDDERNRHIFLALKNAEDVVIEDSLWTIEEMEQGISRILG
jgi:hypothetical protein